MMQDTAGEKHTNLKRNRRCRALVGGDDAKLTAWLGQSRECCWWTHGGEEGKRLQGSLRALTMTMHSMLRGHALFLGRRSSAPCQNTPSSVRSSGPSVDRARRAFGIRQHLGASRNRHHGRHPRWRAYAGWAYGCWGSSALCGRFADAVQTLCRRCADSRMPAPSPSTAW